MPDGGRPCGVGGGKWGGSVRCRAESGGWRVEGSPNFREIETCFLAGTYTEARPLHLKLNQISQKSHSNRI